MKITTAMIMAAGFGSRMMPITKMIAKPMIKINQISLIEYMMQKLYEAGVNKIIINLHHQAILLQDFVINAEISKKFEIIFSYEAIPLEAGGIVKALDYFDEATFYVVNSDIIWLEQDEKLLTKMANYWDEDKMDILLSLHKMDQVLGHDGKGDFNLSDDNRIIVNDDLKNYFFSGLRIVTKKLFLGRDVAKFHFFKDLLFRNRPVKDNIVDRVYGLVHNDLCYDIGNLNGLSIAREQLGKMM